MYTCKLKDYEIYKADNNIFFCNFGMASISLSSNDLIFFLNKWLECHIKLEKIITDKQSTDLYERICVDDLNFDFESDLSCYTEEYNWEWHCNLHFSSGSVWFCIPLSEQDNEKLITALSMWIFEAKQEVIDNNHE